jgi:hypothetical protein
MKVINLTLLLSLLCISSSAIPQRRLAKLESKLYSKQDSFGMLGDETVSSVDETPYSEVNFFTINGDQWGNSNNGEYWYYDSDGCTITYWYSATESYHLFCNATGYYGSDSFGDMWFDSYDGSSGYWIDSEGCAENYTYNADGS